MKNICVFCGSSSGTNPLYRDVARKLALLMALGGHNLIYGGGKLGLMGLMADTMLENNADVVGIIPDFMMDKEVVHRGVTSLHITESMHERKFLMAQMADAFVVLTGGFGTLDETAEIISWNQLGILNKPIVLLNVNNYYDSLVKLADEMLSDGFVTEAARSLVQTADSPEEVLTLLETYQPHNINIWKKIRRG